MLELGTLCIVNARGCCLSPVARNLFVVIAHGEGEHYGALYTVRPICRVSHTMANIPDRERPASELIPLRAYGVRIVRIETTPAGFTMLTVARDPGLAPHAWGDPWKPSQFCGHLDMTTAVDAEALPFILTDRKQEAA